MDRIGKALEVSFERHRSQKRKVNGAPYVVHILDVAKYLLSEPNVPEDVVIAGILHDTLEDTDYSPEELEKEFGKKVLDLVNIATEPGHNIKTSREAKKRTWKSRKQHTIDSCRKASREGMMVLLADKLSNLQSIRESVAIGEPIWKYFNAPKHDIEWYYRSLRSEFKVKIEETRIFKIFDKLVDEVFGVYTKNPR